MRALVVMVVFTFLFVPTSPTQTMRQCHEDAAKWSTETDDQIAALKFGALVERLNYLDICLKRDIDGPQALYLRLQVKYARNFAIRELDYIHRHGEMDSFANEDIAGQR
jgi:hypothetical protein